MPKISEIYPDSCRPGDEVDITVVFESRIPEISHVVFHDGVAAQIGKTDKLDEDTIKITTRVPPSATTGKIEIDTPNLTIISNGDFRVTQPIDSVPRLLGITPTKPDWKTKDKIRFEIDGTSQGKLKQAKVYFPRTSRGPALLQCRPNQVQALNNRELYVTIPEGAHTGRVKIVISGKYSLASPILIINEL